MTLLCSPALVEFENNSSTNSDSYNWMLGDGDSSIDQNPEAKIYTAGNVSEEYSITLEVSNECGSSSATQDITVLPNVVEAGFSSSHIEACAPVNIEFLDSSINTTQIQYDFNGELVSGTNIQREFEIEGVYEVLQYATDGCGFDTTSLEITVFPAPIMDIQILENEICLGESFGFQFLGEELSLTEWTVNGDMVSNSVMDDFTPNLSGEYTIGFQGETALNACEISVSNQIEVRPIPGLELSEDYFSGCSPLSIQLENSADAAENNTYIWQAGDQSSTQHYPSFDFSNPGIYDLEVHAENGFGCSAELNLAEAIEVFTTPVASFDYSPDELDILYNSEVSFSNTSEGGSLYHWNFGDGSESLEINPTHTYEEAGLFPVSLVVTNEHNCIDEFVSGVELEEQFSLFIPNSFTPNSDGINEVFRPQFLGLDYLEYSFIVYDRWGTIIFESYQEDEGWYGNVKNGNHYAASGVYTYEIVFTLPFGQGNKVYGGTVSLIR